MKTTKKEVKDILDVTFARYKGRKFSVEFSDKIWIDRIGGGGSRDDIMIACHDGNRWIAKAPEVSKLTAPCGYLAINKDLVYVVHSMFCGHDVGIRFYIHPESAYKPLMITEVA
jgi:hypothetical protein